MKKLSVLIMTVLAVVLFSSCKDQSGIYVEQLYTNAQKDKAIRACLYASADTAVKHLCVPDGFYNYLNSFYRIDYEPLEFTLFDTLEAHGYGNLADTLILRTNRMAENCGSQVSAALHSAIDSLDIVDYDRLVDGDYDAITHYFEIYMYRYLQSAFQSPVSIRMPIYRVTDTWNAMMQEYIKYTPVPLNFDIQGYIVDRMLDDILTEMSIEEVLIRTDSTHRSADMKLLGK